MKKRIMVIVLLGSAFSLFSPTRITKIKDVENLSKEAVLITRVTQEEPEKKQAFLETVHHRLLLGLVRKKHTGMTTRFFVRVWDAYNPTSNFFELNPQLDERVFIQAGFDDGDKVVEFLRSEQQ